MVLCPYLSPFQSTAASPTQSQSKHQFKFCNCPSSRGKTWAPQFSFSSLDLVTEKYKLQFEKDGRFMPIDTINNYSFHTLPPHNPPFCSWSIQATTAFDFPLPNPTQQASLPSSPPPLLPSSPPPYICSSPPSSLGVVSQPHLFFPLHSSPSSPPLTPSPSPPSPFSSSPLCLPLPLSPTLTAPHHTAPFLLLLLLLLLLLPTTLLRGL